MIRTELDNGMIRLRSAKGIRDSRTGKIHYDVICSEENEKYFSEVEEVKGKKNAAKR